MAIIRASRSISLLLVAVSVLAAGPAAAVDVRAVQPVAYYDADVVARDARALAPEWRRVAAVEERFVGESAPLRAEVDELRTLLGDAALTDPQRRVFETQLAQRTIALLLLRADGMREIGQARDRVLDDVRMRIARAVARVARENGYLVVIRTDRATRVLDEDAIDLTPRVVAELDREVDGTLGTREPAPAPQQPQPGERRRTRMQSCGDQPVACPSGDPGS